MRSKLQEAEQARRSGTRLGAAGTEADWMAAVRMGRKRRAVGADALSEATVSPPPPPPAAFTGSDIAFSLPFHTSSMGMLKEKTNPGICHAQISHWR